MMKLEKSNRSKRSDFLSPEKGSDAAPKTAYERSPYVQNVPNHTLGNKNMHHPKKMH